jgi:hypothetical protein
MRPAQIEVAIAQSQILIGEVISRASNSTSPVGISWLTESRGRSATEPRAAITHSLPISPARVITSAPHSSGRKTTWVSP